MLRPGVVALVLCSALLAAPVRSATADEPPSPDPATRAQAALARVEALFAQQDLTSGPSAPRDRSATLVLRDLALLSDELPAEEQQRAAAYFARPTAHPRRCPDASCYTTKRVHRACSRVVCVHYVRRSDDRFNGVAPRDSDGDGRPNYVEKVLKSLTHVHRTYVAAGYRRPVGDRGRGGDARPDIYLAQIGDWGLYGYCTTDPRTAPNHGGTWAYCVLDNDYRPREFPQHTPLDNMRVTAAHEYFHAVQFGYDIGEDSWFMEATATWIEDEMYDGVDDNVAYLRSGPMRRPAVSLDWYRDGYWYGAWIYIRHLTERFPAAQAGLPTIVRTMWRKADAAGSAAPDLSSMAAIEEALAEQGTSTAEEYLRMAAANLHPRRWYDEGRRYPRTPPDRTWTLTPALPGRTTSAGLDHLTSASYRFEPAPAMTSSDWQLRLTLNLPAEKRGSHALARVVRQSGGVQTFVLDLSATGDFDGAVPFSSTQVKAVELTVVNGSIRYNCAVGTLWSCQGRPLDEDLLHTIDALAEQAS